MSKNRWFKFFPSDFLTGIRNLNSQEVTAYIIVLCELYDHEGICRRDDARMADACRTRQIRFTRAIDALIAKGKIDIADGMLTNKRVSEEIEKRTIAALEKARQRPERDPNETRTKPNQREKGSKNNASSNDVRAYIRNKNKKDIYSTIEGSRPPEPSQAMLDAAEKSPAVARYLARRRLQ